MKKLNVLTLFFIGGIVFWSSCSKSSDSHDDCHDCHIAIDDTNGSHIEFEIGEFCGSALVDVEANGYHTTDTLYSEAGDTLLPGHHDEVHCEEHAH